MHETDIRTKVLAENMDISLPSLLNYFNKMIDSSRFPNHLKLANTTLVHKKTHEMIKETINQSVSYQIYQRFLKNMLNQQASAYFGSISSKQQTCFRRDFILTKLLAYGFHVPSLTFMNSYLTNRHHRVKINNSYSLRKLVAYGIPQRSILGLVLFNIFLYDLFDPWQSRQGSYKFGPIRTSVSNGHFPRWAFLENASFNFSKTWHEVRVL